MDYHQNARLAVPSREQLAKIVAGFHVEGRCSRLQRERRDRGQVGWSLSRAGRKRVEGSKLASQSTSAQPIILFVGKGFGPSPAALEWLAYRQGPASEAGHGRSYQKSEPRTEQLELWIHDDNFHRPHASLKLNTPASRSR